MASASHFTPATLAAENDWFFGTAGCSAGNRTLGFHPAFKDLSTGVVYMSCFADGRPAPVHVLDGLPQHVVTARTAEGRVHSVKRTIVSGFVRDWRFYTREEALRTSEEEPGPVALVQWLVQDR